MVPHRPTRYDSAGRHQFRLPLEALADLYVDGEEALRCGDSTWVMRFCGADDETAGIALFLMGNTAGARSRLSRMRTPSPRSLLFEHLCTWADEGLPSSKEAVLATLCDLGQAGAANALEAILCARRLKALFIGGPIARICSLSKSFADIDCSVGKIDPETGRTHIEWIDRKTDRPLDRDFDVVFVDPSHWMPADLSDVGGVKVGFIGDLEWHFHHEMSRYTDFDLLVSLGTQGKVEAQQRFRRPSYVGPIPAHLGLVSVDDRYLSEDSHLAWKQLERPIDIVSTGHQTHVANLYPDKQVFNRALLGVGREWNVSVLNRILPDDEYLRIMASAKYVASSHRYGLGQSWRAFEALAAGAMIIVDSASGVSARFSRRFSAIHHVRSDFLDDDLNLHLRSYQRYSDDFQGSIGDFFKELNSILPTPQRGVVKTFRTILVLAYFARHGFPDTTLKKWEKSPGCDPCCTVQGDSLPPKAVHQEPAVQSIHASLEAKEWLARRKIRTGIETFAGHREEMAIAHLKHRVGDLTTAALVGQSIAFSRQFPDHGLPVVLEAAALRLGGDLASADQRLDHFLERRENWILFTEDARPEWLLGILPVADLVGGAMRDSLSRQRRFSVVRISDSMAFLRAMFTVTALSMQADSALRLPDPILAAAKSGEALALHPWSGPAAAIYLQSLRHGFERVEQAKSEFLSAFDSLAARSHETFHTFSWSALRASVSDEDETAIGARTAAFALSWVRMGRPAGGGMVPKWAVEDARISLASPVVSKCLTTLGFTPSAYGF